MEEIDYSRKNVELLLKLWNKKNANLPFSSNDAMKVTLCKIELIA